MVHHKRSTCRACGNTDLTCFLSLGSMPLANAFLKGPDEIAGEPSYPLDVYFCRDCSLVQLLDVIDPEVLFRDYIYVTGTSDAMATHNRELARSAVETLGLTSSDLVVEIASNDGSLLSCFQALGVSTLGIEPAANLAELARARGIETVDRFFDRDVAESVRSTHGPAALVIGNNVLAHVDETVEFMRAARLLAEPNGIVSFESPYIGPMVERLEYDTIYHEHLCYFSATALARLCDEAGLSTEAFTLVPVHGGSFRLLARPATDRPAHCEGLVSALERERADGLTTLACFEDFAAGAGRARGALRSLLDRLRGEGRTVAAYGAAAKGNTLLNFCRIDSTIIQCVADKNPMKVGRLTPGSHLPVVAPDELLARRPDYVVILAWNYAEEIMREHAAYRDGGGQFIIPVPEATIV